MTENNDTPIEQQAQYLTFLMGGEEYGIDILRVKEIRGYEKPTLIPATKPYMKGVINLRGLIVPVMDLRQRFDIQYDEANQNTVVIILQLKTRLMGVIVDAVSEVYHLDDTKLQPIPDNISQAKAHFIKGLGTADNKLIVVLDIEKLMNLEDSLDVPG